METWATTVLWILAFTVVFRLVNMALGDKPPPSKAIDMAIEVGVIVWGVLVGVRFW